MTDTYASFTEWGVRWRAGDFERTDPYDSEQDARDFAQLINPTGDARTEIVTRTVTEWQPITTPR